MTYTPRSSLAPLVWALTALGLPIAAGAQFNEPPPPAAYALHGVTVVRADGSRLENQTIVVRGGLIAAMGSGIEVPTDAQVLEGDSLLVYPGLIDAWGKADYKFPEAEIDRQQIASWAPPREVQGFVPHRRVVDVLTANGSGLKSERAKGVVAAAVHPDGPVMPGQGTLLLFRPNGDSPRDLVVRPVLAPTFTFERARGVYPSTLFAVTAFMRQAFEDAKHDGAVQQVYQQDPRGMTLPEWDPDYAILRDVMAGGRVFFEADQSEDIRNALRLASEYGFRPVILGGGEAWKVAALLKQRQVPVLVSVNFPKPKQWKPAKKAAVADTTTPAQAAQPLDAAAEREKDEIEARYRNAAKLVEAGVTVALTSGGGRADLLEGARKAIEYGLPEQQALAALTSTPAALLGVPTVVRVEANMPATFIVTDGGLFAEGTNIAYAFVEGVMEKGKAKASGVGSEAPAVNVTGTWDLEIDAGGQTLPGTMTLTQEGATFSGSLSVEVGAVQVTNGSVSGTAISFNLVVNMGGQEMTMDATGTVQGSQASGSGNGPMGSFNWTATRKTPQEGVR